MTKYVCLSIPKQLMNKVDEKLSFFAYSSRTDFVKQAIRRELERVERITVKQ